MHSLLTVDTGDVISTCIEKWQTFEEKKKLNKLCFYYGLSSALVILLNGLILAERLQAKPSTYNVKDICPYFRWLDLISHYGIGQIVTWT